MQKSMMMTSDEFERRITIHRVHSETMIAAARKVLVDGKGQRETCRMVGCTPGQLNPIIKKLRSDTCPCCGQAI